MDLLSLGYTQWDGCVVEFPCGNRFSTSQGTVPPITDTLMYLQGSAQPIVTYLQNSFFCKQNPCLILRKPATLVLSFVCYHNTPLTINWLCVSKQ